MIGLILSAGALLTGGLSSAYALSPVRRALRRAKRKVRKVEREAVATRESVRARRLRLQTEAEAWARDWRREKLEATPIEALKSVGASQVRWSALRDAGLDSVAKIRGASSMQLVNVKGIGPVSAKRLADAAARLESRYSESVAPPPPPELESPEAREMVRAGLDLLRTREALGDTPDQVEQDHQRLTGEIDQLQKRSGPLRWLWSLWTRRPWDMEVEAAEELGRDADEVLESGSAAQARALRDSLRTLEPVPSGRKELTASYRDRYAELVAAFEGAFTPEAVGLEPRAHRPGAHLPDEIVDRIEELPLRVGGLSVVLRGYQDFGARYLIVQERTILGDDMGLGKTLQSLAAMVHLAAVGEGRHFLVVAPATVVPNWTREIEQRTRLDGHVLHGAEREAAAQRWIEMGGVAVTSYSTLRRMELASALAASRTPIHMLVADEAHYLKNPETSRSIAVADLLPLSGRACLMTGTPIENRLEEFRVLIQLVRPDMLSEHEWSSADEDVDPAAFQRQLARVYLRRNQTDVLHELPPRIEKEEWVELTDDEQRAYASAVGEGNIMAMRRAATVGEWKPTKRARPPASSKIERLVQLVEEHREAGRKILVFSFFLDVLEAVSRRVDVLGSIQGGIPSEDRVALMDAFKEKDGHAVLLGQIQAAGVGLNLQAASVVVLMEPQWKPSIEEQAIARAHRMGQSEKVVVHRLLAKDSVDERIMDLVAGKQELFELYARESVVKDASARATETAMARMVVEAEQARMDARPAR